MIKKTQEEKLDLDSYRELNKWIISYTSDDDYKNYIRKIHKLPKDKELRSKNLNVRVSEETLKRFEDIQSILGCSKGDIVERSSRIMHELAKMYFQVGLSPLYDKDYSNSIALEYFLLGFKGNSALNDIHYDSNKYNYNPDHPDYSFDPHDPKYLVAEDESEYIKGEID